MQVGEKIRVLYVSYDGLLDPLGYSQVQAYLKALAARGVNLEVLSFEKRTKFQDLRKKSEVENALKELGVGWNPLLYHGRFSIVSTLYDVCAGVRRARKIIKEFSPRIIHARSYIAAMIAVLVRTSDYFVFDMRGFWPDERVEGGAWSKSGPVYRVFKYLEKKYLEKADAVVVLTERARDIVLGWLGNAGCPATPVEVIPTCADTGVFRPVGGQREKRTDALEIAYLGSLGSWYLIDEMLDFFRVLLEKYPESRFRFITNSPAAVVGEALERRKFSEREKAAIEITKVGHHEVPATLDSVDATIFFIMSSFSKQGSCATKFAESLACGKPVVINSGVGDHDSHVKRSGAGVIVGQFGREGYIKAVDELAALVANPETTAKCTGFVEKEMSVAVGSERYLNLYRFLIERKLAGKT